MVLRTRHGGPRRGVAIQRHQPLAGHGAARLAMTMGAALCLAVLLGACSPVIRVQAPDKPIEINLNVNVKQEVVVRLQKDAEDFIANNPELFPQ